MGRFRDDLEKERAGGFQALPVDDPTKGAGFWPRWHASWHDDPQARMEEFSQYRPGAEYRLDPTSGGISYKDPATGEWHLEEPSGWQSGLLGALADVTGGGMPAEVGGAVGALAGPLGGVLGGAAGEAAKQGIQAYLDPRERSLMSAGLQTGLAGLGGAAGEALGWAGRRVLARRPDLAYDPARAVQLGEASREFGIPLYPHEVSGAKELGDLQSLLYDSSRTGSEMRRRLEDRASTIENAVNSYLDELGPSHGIERVNEIAGRASNMERDAMKAERRAASEPFYSAAGRDTVQPSSVLGGIDVALGNYPERSETARALRKARDLLTEPSDAGPVPIQDVRRLHGAKMELDDMIESAKRAGNNNLARELLQVQESLLGSLDSASPNYAAGRAAYETFSGPINEFDMTMAGAAAKTSRDRSGPAYRLSDKLFGSTSSPYEIGIARDSIDRAAPGAWDAVVRAHLQRNLDELKDSAVGGLDNIGGAFRKKVFGSERQRTQLKAALGPERYKRLDRLMSVLEATGLSARSQSMTEPRQQMRKQIERQATPFLNRLTSPYDWASGALKEKNLDDLYNGLMRVAMSESTAADFTLDRALREIEKYRGKIPRERSKGMQSMLQLILQGGTQAGSTEDRY